MSAPLSPAFSEISVTFCCSEEGSDGIADSDYCSPELKRAKRLDSAQLGHRVGESLKQMFPKSTFRSGVKESESRLSSRSASNCNSFPGYEYYRNSNHSLPTIEHVEPSSTQFDRRSSLEGVQPDSLDAEDGTVRFERRASLEEDLASDEEGEMKNDRKARVVSSYCNHLKETQQLVGSDRGSRKTYLTVPTQPSDFGGANVASLDGFAENEVLDKRSVKAKFGLSEMTYESGEDRIHKILLPAHLETLSTTNSHQDDDAALSGLNPTEAAETHRTPAGNAGDSQTWDSHIEKEYKNKLEFSTLVTLAYVRVRDLTNTIDKAYNYLETIDKKDSEEAKETNELRSEIQALFDERANLSLEHSKWRSEFSEHYLRRKKVLSKLKSQAALAEESYFKLRKELEDFQKEPILTKPKRNWFSRLCAFIK